MPACVASSKPNRGASDLYLGSGGAKNEVIALAARGPWSARGGPGDHAACLATTPTTDHAGRRAIRGACRAEVTMRKTLDELGSAARASADVVAMRVAADLAHRRLVAVGIAMLLAVLARATGDPLDGSLVAAEDPHFSLAACVGRVRRAEGARHAPPNDEPAGRANFSAGGAERGAIERCDEVFAAADEAILFIARAERAGVRRAEARGRGVVAGVQAEVYRGAGGRLAETGLRTAQEPALGAERWLPDPRRVVGMGAAGDERAFRRGFVDLLRVRAWAHGSGRDSRWRRTLIVA